MTRWDILTLDEIKEALKDRKLSVVADTIGLSYPTLKSLADGEKQNYSIDTLSKVSNYLKGESFNE